MPIFVANISKHLFVMTKKLLTTTLFATLFALGTFAQTTDKHPVVKAVNPTTKAIVTLPLGDANGDGSVNGSDITVIASYILGQNPETFYSVAADFTKDGTVNGSDITALAAFILSGATQTETVTDATKSDEYTPNPQL